MKNWKAIAMFFGVILCVVILFAILVRACDDVVEIEEAMEAETEQVDTMSAPVDSMSVQVDSVAVDTVGVE